MKKRSHSPSFKTLVGRCKRRLMDIRQMQILINRRLKYWEALYGTKVLLQAGRELKLWK